MITQTKSSRLLQRPTLQSARKFCNYTKFIPALVLPPTLYHDLLIRSINQDQTKCNHIMFEIPISGSIYNHSQNTKNNKWIAQHLSFGTSFDETWSPHNQKFFDFFIMKYIFHVSPTHLSLCLVMIGLPSTFDNNLSFLSWNPHPYSSIYVISQMSFLNFISFYKSTHCHWRSFHKH